MKTRTSRISWLRGRNRRTTSGGWIGEQEAMACLWPRLRYAKERVVQSVQTSLVCNPYESQLSRNSPLSLAWFFQFLSRFYTLSCTRMSKKIYPVYLFPRALVFIDREGKMNKIKLKLSCIYIIGLLSNRIQRCLGCIIMWN